MEPARGSGASPGKRRATSVSRVDMVVTVVAVIVVLAGLGVAFVFAPEGPDRTHAQEGQRSESVAPRSAVSAPTPAVDRAVVPPLAIEAERWSSQLVCKSLIGSMEFTALSYNIKSGRAGGLSRLLGTIQRSRAEVLLLQEVDNRRRSTGSVDQAGWFAERLGGWHHAFGTNVTFGDGLYGTAVVSKYPIVSFTNTRLPNSGNAQPRGLLHVVVDIEGVEVSIYSTHLDNTSEGIRSAQASRIAGIVGADPRPKIVGGDMNAWPGARPARILTSVLNDSFAVAGSGGGATHPAGRPRGRIDYLLYGGPDLSALSSDVLPDVSSDHRAVRAKYRLGGIKTEKCNKG